ncbi:MAG: hypothetical protein AC479_03035 [miscellaneous Crenarchaeota group-6 archaeon AD8-1]|nr:MAG: hypothetical protein AC479_03035 [miscellaneous Crenarchaeota group-6 archaeon AD8-1]
MPKAYWGEIKDPIHGFVYISELEKKIIDSFPLQRLRRLRQLAGSEYVYPGANHTRFEHSIGTMYLAGKVAENPNISRRIVDQEFDSIRISALLHDIGHGPFSHIFEYLLSKKLHKTHEDLTTWLVQKSQMSDIISESGFNPKKISLLAVGKLQEQGKTFLNQIISSAVDVDKQDFIVRDTFHTGAEYGFIDIFRLIHALNVLHENLAVEIGAISAIEAFMIARIESFKSIYFHRVGRAAQIMLSTAMEKADEELGLTAFRTPEEYLALDDYTVWSALKKCTKSKKIINNLEKRKLLKCAYERTFYEKDTTVSNIFGLEPYRTQIQNDIAKIAKVDAETVIIDVPTVESVPYHNSVLMESMEVPVFNKNQINGNKAYKLTELSKIIENLKGFLNILRVYTIEKNRQKVEQATVKILGRVL